MMPEYKKEIHFVRSFNPGSQIPTHGRVALTMSISKAYKRRRSADLLHVRLRCVAIGRLPCDCLV